MRHTLVFVLLVATPLFAQSSGYLSLSSPTPAASTAKAGTEFLVEVHHSVRADRAKPGDTVEFRTIEPVLAGKGIVIPTGASLRGSIVVSRSACSKAPSVLRFTIDAVKWSKRVIRLNGAVVRVARRRFKMTSGHYQQTCTGLEGVVVAYARGASAATILTASKNVVLQRGTVLYVRHFEK